MRHAFKKHNLYLQAQLKNAEHKRVEAEAATEGLRSKGKLLEEQHNKLQAEVTSSLCNSKGHNPMARFCVWVLVFLRLVLST